MAKNFYAGNSVGINLESAFLHDQAESISYQKLFADSCSSVEQPNWISETQVDKREVTLESGIQIVLTESGSRRNSARDQEGLYEQCSTAPIGKLERTERVNRDGVNCFTDSESHGHENRRATNDLILNRNFEDSLALFRGEHDVEIVYEQTLQPSRELQSAVSNSFEDMNMPPIPVEVMQPMSENR